MEQQLFNNGPIDPGMLAAQLQACNGQPGTGAYSFFAGQIRADVVGEKKVAAIEYTAYEAMAATEAAVILEEIKAQYQLTYIAVRHSLGVVKAGELCLLVVTAAPHRKAAINACNELVERIKSELPIWGKELFEGEGYQWKVNQ